MTLAVASPVSLESRPAARESQRIAFLTRHFRMWYAIVEREIVDALARLSRHEYAGPWRGHDLTNGSCFLAPVAGTFRIDTPRGPVEVSAETAGVIATLAALQSLAERHPTKQLFAVRVRQLRELACRHADAATIFAAVD